MTYEIVCIILLCTIFLFGLIEINMVKTLGLPVVSPPYYFPFFLLT